jgi:hypothetical protein
VCFCASRGKTPLAVETGLEKITPAEYKRYAHHWLILHGRHVCKARKPECPDCLVADLCHYGAKTGPAELLAANASSGEPAPLEEPGGTAAAPGCETSRKIPQRILQCDVPAHRPRFHPTCSPCFIRSRSGLSHPLNRNLTPRSRPQ